MNWLKGLLEGDAYDSLLSFPCVYSTTHTFSEKRLLWLLYRASSVIRIWDVAVEIIRACKLLKMFSHTISASTLNIAFVLGAQSNSLPF